MDIRQICGNIRQREVLLYGDQNEIELFLEKYHNVLNIQCVLTEYKDEVRLQPCLKWGINTIMMDQAKYSSNQLIVICAKKKFDILKERLTYIGKKEYHDYISCELVEALLYGKKLMVCMGTQLIEQVCFFLEYSKNIYEQYSMVYFRESELMEPYMNRLVECIHVSRYCDIYIRSACEKELFPIKVADNSIVNKNCKVITVADFGFGGYYPQIINDRDKISPYLLRGYDRLPMSYETLAFSRTDEEVVKLCKEGLLTEDIIEKLLDPNYYKKEKVQCYFIKQLERFKEMEKTADIRLGEYIEKHKGEYLCRNLNEWNEPVISYIIEELSKLIDLAVLDIDEKQRVQLIEENSGSETIIYPSMQKALEMQELLKDKKYKVVTYHQSRYMTIEEYLYFIIEYINKAMDIEKYTRMDDALLYK